MKTIKIFFLISVIFLISCIDEWDKFLDTKLLDYKITNASDNFKNYSKIHIEQYKNTLTLKLHIKQLIKQPKNEENKISFYKSFKFSLYDENNNIIKIDPLYQKQFFGSVVTNSSKLKYKSKDYNITKTNDIELSIPLIYFYKLKHGEHKIKLKITDSNENIISKLKNNYSDKDINIDFWGDIEFTLKVPEIYETTICNDSIILQNDKDFSPSGMDFSLRDGLPDIYWYIIYRSDENNFEKINSKHEANYAVMYTYRDTISFLHFSKPQNIEISVMDRDDLSPDDIIGVWKGNFNNLESSNNNYTSLKFDHIDKFKIKIIKKNKLIN